MITFIFQCQVLVRWRNISFQAFNPCRRKSYLVFGMGNYSKYSWILTTFNITWHLCCLGSWIKINLENNQIFKASMLSHSRKSLVVQQQQKHCEVHNRIIQNAITDEWVIHCLREIIYRASLVRTMSSCTNCARSFSLLNREKACAKCGFAFCSKCLLSYNGSKVRLRSRFQDLRSHFDFGRINIFTCILIAFRFVLHVTRRPSPDLLRGRGLH